MIKNIVIALFYLASLSLSAEPVSFNLHQISLSDLCRVIIDDVAGKSLILSSDIVRDQELVTYSVKRVEPGQAIEQLELLLNERGYKIKTSNNVYHIVKKQDDDEDIYIYQPLHRSVSYITDLISGVVGRGAVTTQRQIASDHQITQSNVTESSATSAYSFVDKGLKDVLVVKAKPEQIAAAKKIIAQVDTPIPEMLVKAVVLEVQTGQSEGSAIDFLLKLVSKGLGSASINWQGGADASAGISVKVGGIEALWSAINSDKRFKVISAPRLRVKSGASARFAVGSDVPVLGAIQYQGNGQSQQSVEYKPSGVILELRPEIRGKKAELKIDQQLSSFARTETGVNNSPTLLKRELSTSVIVDESDVVLLAGLDEEKTQTDDTGFFFLPDFLRSKSSQSTRSEIVLMLYVERVG